MEYITLAPHVFRREALYDKKSLLKFRDSIQIGQQVKFHLKTLDGYGRTKSKDVCGIVTKKYPYIFELDDGKTYQYVDYMINKVY